MKEIINEKLIELDLNLKFKDIILLKLARKIHEDGRLTCDCDKNKTYKSDCNDYLEFVKALKEREEVFSTAVGYSFAIPHGKSGYVKDTSIVYASLKEEMYWSEEEKIKHIFMIGVPDSKASNEHLEILIKLSTSILDDDFRKKIENFDSKKEILDLIQDYVSRER